MQPTQMDKITLCTLYLFAAGIPVVQALGLDSLISPLFSATFVLAVLVWLSAAYRRVTWLDAVAISIVFLTFFHVVLNSWITSTHLSFSYFKKFIMFSFTLLFFQIMNKLQADDDLIHFLLGLNTFIALFFIGYFFTNREMSYYFKGQITQYLTFRFTNPNLASMFLLCIYMGELLHLFQKRSQLSKLFHLILAFVLFYFLWETQARNALLVTLFASFFTIILYYSKTTSALPGWIIFLIAIWPLLFAILYLAVIESPLIQQIFSFIADEGKELNSRIGIWSAAFHYFRESPVLGAYSQISHGTGMSQLHNTHVDILVSYGISVLILVCYYLYKLVHDDDDADRFEAASKLFFACTIIMGMGEAALFSGGLGLYLWASMFLLTSKCVHIKAQED